MIRSKIFKVALGLIAVSVLGCVPDASAQGFLKKLGKAVDKALSKSSDPSSDNNGLGRKLGNTINLGSMTMEAYGDNPGVGFNFGECVRDGKDVVLTFSLPNQGRRDVENVWLRNYNDDATTVTGPDGTRYEVSYLKVGDTGSGEGISVNIPVKQEPVGFIRVSGVPETVKTLGQVVFRCSGQYPMDATTHRYAFVLGNVPVKEPATKNNATSQASAASAMKNYVMPAGGWTITREGVGPLTLGAVVESLPAKVTGLYDAVRIDGTSAYAEYKGEDVITMNLSNGKIIGLQVYGTNVTLKVGTKTFKVGGDCDLLKKQQGVKGESYNDSGEYQGVSFDGHDSEIQFFAIGTN